MYIGDYVITLLFVLILIIALIVVIVNHLVNLHTSPSDENVEEDVKLFVPISNDELAQLKKCENCYNCKYRFSSGHCTNFNIYAKDEHICDEFDWNEVQMNRELMRYRNEVRMGIANYRKKEDSQ